MFQFQAQIIENGKQRFYSMGTTENSFTHAANEITRYANVKNGATVQVAKMTFDYPTKQFIVTAYTFEVVDGKVENLQPAK